MDYTIVDLIKEGKLEGFLGAPTMIETVISRVFIFDVDDIVLKIYKRDNNWWNTNIQDLSGGALRSRFIRHDFEFNHFLNPKIYLEIKALVCENGTAKLVDLKDADDELVIVMHKEDVSETLTEVLYEGKLKPEEYKDIGQSLAKIKLSLPKSFLPDNKSNWYEQMTARLEDLSGWILSEKDFPKELADKALAKFGKILEENQSRFQSITKNDLFPLIDCNPENLIYSHKELRFLDVYPPKDDWRIGTFEMDIFRVAGDVCALAGEDAYDAFMEGAVEIAAGNLDKSLSDFYLLYGAMITAPYFFMLSNKNEKYKVKAEKYLKFVEKIVG